MQSERVEETRDGRGVRIFVGINPWDGRARASERERESARAGVHPRPRLPSAGAGPRWPCSSRPHHSRRPSISVRKSGRGAFVGELGSPTRQEVQSREKTRGPTRSKTRQRASSRLEARSSTGLDPTGPGVQGESSGPVDNGSGHGRRRTWGPATNEVGGAVAGRTGA